MTDSRDLSDQQSRPDPASYFGTSTERTADVVRDVTEGRELLAARRRPPVARGWRKWVSKMTAGRIDPGPSAKQEYEAQLMDSVRATLAGVHKVAFVSSKGGVGKSTMTVAVGNTIASLRGDRVIAVDVDADLGDLSARFSERGGPEANIEHVAHLHKVDRYSDVREHTIVNGDRLEMLASQNNPSSSYRLGPEDYAATMKILEAHCNVILLDCGTPVNGPLFRQIVGDVTGLVVVASQDVRGVEGALATLDWLHAHGFDQLLEHTVVALNALQKTKPLIDRKAVEHQFRKRVPAVFRVPYDPHLAAGLAVDSASLKRRTSNAVLELAAGIAQHYPAGSVRRHRKETLDDWIDTIRRD